MQIITNVIQFITAIIASIAGSLPLTIVFMLASFLPGIFQRILGRNIEEKSKEWDKSNSKYTENVKETEMFSASARDYIIQKIICGKGLSPLLIQWKLHY